MWVLVVYNEHSDTVYVYGGTEKKPWTSDQANEAAAEYVRRHISNKGNFSSDTFRMTVIQIEALAK
jgi:hypothetical protein